MAVRVFHRPARTKFDLLPQEALEIPSVPTLERPSADTDGSLLRLMLPLLAGGGMLIMMVSTGNRLRMFAGAAFIMVALLMALSMYIRSKIGNRKRAEQEREIFIDYLARLRAEVEPEIHAQRKIQHTLHPRPHGLFSVIADPARIYERRRRDPDFATVRIGTGPGPLAREVRYGSVIDPRAVVDSIAAAHLERMRSSLQNIDGLPLTIPLFGTVSIVGSSDACHRVLRAALTQFLTFHAPEDAAIHLCLGKDAKHFDWLRFAPHTQDPDRFDGPVHARRVSTHRAEMAARLTAMISARPPEARNAYTPFLVIIADRQEAPDQDPLTLMPEGVAPEQIGICVISLARKRILEPSEVTTRVEIDDDGRVQVVDVATGHTARAGGHRDDRLARGAARGSVDAVPQALAATIARTLAPVRLVEDAAREAPLETTITIETLLGIDDIGTFDPQQTWRNRPIDQFLRVPFGIDGLGNDVYLDLKESALEGHGPHGLCIGATGSGKSEVLRTMVLAMAINHPPERLALVLVDYKGGAAFNGLDILPHTAAMVDNLGDEEGLVDRLHDAISGELIRRQRVLQEAGAKNVYDYNDRRDAGADLDPLPNLCVIIDEFGEILEQKPEFILLFVQIGRIGRSIGVHLLLSSQRLEEGRLRGLESHLSYRLCLRTFSAAESRAVIGTPDANTLPAVPGSGYLKVDPDVYTRFKGAYVSSRYEPAHERIDLDLPPIPIPYSMINASEGWLERQKSLYAAERKESVPPGHETPFDKIVLEVAAERMAHAAQRVAQIWLPPLPASVEIEDVLGQPEVIDGRGLQIPDSALHARLRFPLGLLDDPQRQDQRVWTVDTSAANLLVLGASQTGKTTTARALVVGSALTHTPAEVAWYIIDAGSSTLTKLDELPHVGGVATRFEPDRIRRAVAEVHFELTRREALFADERIDSAEHFRRQSAAARDNAGIQRTDASTADIYLLVDGWATFSADFEDLLATVTDIILRGLNYGVHVVIIANRMADLRMNLQTNMGTIVEHRLNNPIDSMLSRQMQQRLSTTTPGRIINPDKLIVQVIDSTTAAATQLSGRIVSAWTGPAAAPIRMLPEEVSHLEVLQRARARSEVVPAPALIGVEESTLSAVQLDLLDTDPHLIILGDSGSGRTTLIRSVLGDLVSRTSAERINIIVVDPRRGLLGLLPDEVQGGYITTRDSATTMLDALADFLSSRLPGAGVTPEQLRSRSWWSGAETIVVIDDYDLFVSSTSLSGNPLAPLVGLIAQSRDVGLHLILARRAGGSARAMFDPVLTALRDDGAAGVLLSGDRAEGQIYTKVYFQTEPPGRGRLIRRGQDPARVQFVNWTALQQITAHDQIEASTT